jgi:hypothetical protein
MNSPSKIHKVKDKFLGIRINYLVRIGTQKASVSGRFVLKCFEHVHIHGVALKRWLVLEAGFERI